MAPNQTPLKFTGQKVGLVALIIRLPKEKIKSTKSLYLIYLYL